MNVWWLTYVVVYILAMLYILIGILYTGRRARDCLKGMEGVNVVLESISDEMDKVKCRPDNDTQFECLVKRFEAEKAKFYPENKRADVLVNTLKLHRYASRFLLVKFLVMAVLMLTGRWFV